MRGCSAFRLLGSADGMNFAELSAGTIPSGQTGNANVPLLINDTVLTNASAVRAFRLELTRLTNGGPRGIECDATGTVATLPAGAFLDRLAFNAATNTYTGRGGAGRDDEGPGMASHSLSAASCSAPTRWGMRA